MTQRKLQIAKDSNWKFLPTPDMLSAPLAWTTEAPTKPGLFWTACTWRTDNIRIVEVANDYGTHLGAYVLGDERESELSSFTHWLGPLDVPEPPKVTE